MRYESGHETHLMMMSSDSISPMDDGSAYLLGHGRAIENRKDNKCFYEQAFFLPSPFSLLRSRSVSFPLEGDVNLYEARLIMKKSIMIKEKRISSLFLHVDRKSEK